MAERILLAEDDASIAATVEYALTAEGYEVDVVGDGAAALDRVAAISYDLLLLDIALPRLSGMEVCRRVRSESVVPIVMVTAKDAEVDRVLGLESGADDYVTKPFSLAELVSRVRAILRRRTLDRGRSLETTLRAGELVVDLRSHEVTIDGTPVPLTPSEFRLLALLAGEAGRVFGRAEIMRHLWSSDYASAHRACDIHVSNLRRKIERDPARPERIVTV